MKTRKRRAQDAGREEQQGTSGTQRLEAEFVQYRAMRQEIAAMRRQRAALYVTDTVRASGSEHPYLAHTVAIAGKDQRLTRRIDARIEFAPAMRNRGKRHRGGGGQPRPPGAVAALSGGGELAGNRPANGNGRRCRA